jgi:hypothetical protein
VQPEKKNDRWRAGRDTLPGEWGRHCSTVASHLAWRRKNIASINGGGGGGVHRGVDQTRHYTLLIPPEEPTVFTVASPKHGTAHRLPPPPRKTHASWNGGGGWVCSPWRRPSTALNDAYPPPNFTVASPKHGTERRLSPPNFTVASRKHVTERRLSPH